MGRLGWGDESHVRVLDAGVRVASGAIVGFVLIVAVLFATGQGMRIVKNYSVAFKNDACLEDLNQHSSFKLAIRNPPVFPSSIRNYDARVPALVKNSF